MTLTKEKVERIKNAYDFATTHEVIQLARLALANLETQEWLKQLREQDAYTQLTLRKLRGGR